MSNLPISIRVYRETEVWVERPAYGQMKENGRTVKMLIYEPPQNGRRMGRYRLVDWCEAHAAGWEGSGCPLCENSAGERMRRILAAEKEPPVNHAVG